MSTRNTTQPAVLKKDRMFSVRLDDEDGSLLTALVAHLKLKRADLVRIALRRMAEDELLRRKR